MIIFDASDNQIHSLFDTLFDSIRKVTAINLSNNKIEELPSNLFKETLELEEFDISKNKIKELKEHTFDRLKKLRHLMIAENNIGTPFLKESDQIWSLVDFNIFLIIFTSFLIIIRSLFDLFSLQIHRNDRRKHLPPLTFIGKTCFGRKQHKIHPKSPFRQLDTSTQTRFAPKSNFKNIFKCVSFLDTLGRLKSRSKQSRYDPEWIVLQYGKT